MHPYTKPEFDAFGWSPLSGSSLPPAETYGLDYQSARECSPRWFGVSFGNGNDGVTFPDYYVRTADPFKLAAAAVIGMFKDEYKERAADVLEVDGEADYTISAMILNPEDVEGYECPVCGMIDSHADDCEADESEDDNGSYCDANGAWLICEVFPVDEMPGALLFIGNKLEHVQYNPDPYGKPAYCSLADAFDAEDLRLAEK